MSWERTGLDTLRLLLPNSEREFRFRTAPGGAIQLASPEGSTLAWAVRSGDETLVAMRGSVFRLHRSGAEDEDADTEDMATPEVLAPMPGRVVKIFVDAGQTVERGDPLLVLEAMKMETHIVAEARGEVVKVCVTPGAMVQGGQLLLELAYD